jgi:exodeoxyribonuclease-5
VTPSAAQLEAVRAILEWYRGGDSTPQEFYLAGYAGTGKTTIYKLIRQTLLDAGARNILTAAFTGKASLVLRKKDIEDACTLHSLLYCVQENRRTGKLQFVLDRMGPMRDADLLGVDEVSMVSRELADDARSFGKKILVLGDPGQLPPVNGAGAFTNREPDFFLHEIHRQAAESPIIRIATLAREGRPIPLGDYGNGVQVVPLTPETHNLAYRPETQAICGTHRTRKAIVRRCRMQRDRSGTLPQAGEPVICMRNDRDNGLFNGMLGTMLSDATPRKFDVLNLNMDVLMEDSRELLELPTTPWHFEQHFGPDEEKPRIDRCYQEFDWAYALTCHKAQGSEYEDVTLIDDGGFLGANRSKWNYTGLTRASDRLTFIKRAA